MRTLYKTSKANGLGPKLCDFEDLCAGDTVFAGGAPVVVGDAPAAWELALTDTNGNVWQEKQLDHQVVLTSLSEVMARLTVALDAEEPVFFTDGTVTCRIACGAGDRPLSQDDALGVPLETGAWAWVDTDAYGELKDVGLVEMSSELYLAPIWWAKI